MWLLLCVNTKKIFVCDIFLDMQRTSLPPPFFFFFYHKASDFLKNREILGSIQVQWLQLWYMWSSVTLGDSSSCHTEKLNQTECYYILLFSFPFIKMSETHWQSIFFFRAIQLSKYSVLTHFELLHYFNSYDSLESYCTILPGIIFALCHPHKLSDTDIPQILPVAL